MQFLDSKNGDFNADLSSYRIFLTAEAQRTKSLYFFHSFIIHSLFVSIRMVILAFNCNVFNLF